MTKSYTIPDYLAVLNAEPAAALLHAYQTGLEREGLRVTADGHISPRPHPVAVGSALTHPYITTDFSEAQLELVSRPCQSISELTQLMESIHAYTARHLESEWLWPYSMPMHIKNDDEIPVAHFGTSPQGQMKAIYREGLTRRYRKRMQIISGIHFNFSWKPAFWEHWYQLHQPQTNLQDWINESYLGVMRNFLRYSWLLTYLFGVSPVADRTFLDDMPPELQPWDTGSMYGRDATSLRMSQVGYVSNRRCKFGVSYNHLTSYMQDIHKAVSTPCSDFSRLGVLVEGHYHQLNDHILQIENEHYSLIRAKQPLQLGERPLTALMKRGVSYIEVRGVDLNPFEPIGVDEFQLRFLHLFLLYMLLSPSPSMSADEEKRHRANQAQVALLGRQPGLQLDMGVELVLFREWGQTVLNELVPLAELLDKTMATPIYQTVLQAQMAKIQDPENTPSAQLLQTLQAEKMTLQDWNLQQAQKHAQHWDKLELPPAFVAEFEALTQQSLKDQDALESDNKQTIADFLAAYAHQLKAVADSFPKTPL